MLFLYPEKVRNTILVDIYSINTITWWHWHFEFIDQAGPMKGNENLIYSIYIVLAPTV